MTDLDIKKNDRVRFNYVAGGIKKTQYATVAKGPYKDPLTDEIVVDLDCDGWTERLLAQEPSTLEVITK